MLSENDLRSSLAIARTNWGYWRDVYEHRHQQIKLHVPTLLVQDEDPLQLAEKRAACERVIGDLYDIRCQVMHGNNVIASDEVAMCVRQIAAGVLRSISCWIANQERSGRNTTWKALLNEVGEARKQPGIVVGCPDLSELIPDEVPR
jgi:hypothetical protein